MITCLEMARILDVAAGRARADLVAPTAKLVTVLAEDAKSLLGVYQEGWPALSPRTLERKAADTPGIETGAMRKSIEAEAHAIPGGAEGVIGSNDKNALWFELGTVHQPPRPFLALAMSRSEAPAAEIFSAFAVEILEGK